LKPLRILLIDDDQEVCQFLHGRLQQAGYEVRKANSGKAALDLIQNEVFDAVLLDIHLPDMTGIQILNELKKRDPEIDAVIMTGDSQVKTAIEALRLGAYDYITRPVEWVSLDRLLQRLSERRYLRDEVMMLRRRLAETPGVGEFIGVSCRIQQLRDLIARVAATDSTVLIEGEGGTGKELIGYAIHGMSNRKKKPFITVHCATMPPELMESELFGDLKGAISGSRGLFQAAEGGTLFLNDITDLPMTMQPKLVRALQEKEIHPVGSSEVRPVDVRIIAATNQNLKAAVDEGRFRQDLYFRLNVVRLEAPPLRSIKEDIPLIAMHFVRSLNRRFGRKVSHIAPDAMSSLMAYDFPGNVRELENVLERAYALGAEKEITLSDLPTISPPLRSTPSVYGPGCTLDDLERELVSITLQTYQNDKSKAAEALGMSERTLYRRLKKHGIGFTARG
jgi:DNA-binding NtrC family response regulator